MELWDVFDEENRPTDRVIDKRQGLQPGEYRRIVELWVRGADGQYLIQQRSRNKKLFPGMWYCSVSGAVQSGETPMKAAQREAVEELGFVLDPERAALYGIISEDFAHFYIWIFRQEINPAELVLEPAEVAAVQLASREKIEAMIVEGSFIKLPYYEEFFNWVECAENEESAV